MFARHVRIIIELSLGCDRAAGRWQWCPVHRHVDCGQYKRSNAVSSLGLAFTAVLVRRVLLVREALFSSSLVEADSYCHIPMSSGLLFVRIVAKLESRTRFEAGNPAPRQHANPSLHMKFCCAFVASGVRDKSELEHRYVSA